MRAYLFATAAALGAAFMSGPAVAHSFSVGSLAASCYQASINYGVKPQAVADCTRALDEEPLSFDDRVATFVNRGIVRMNMGQHAAADTDFDTAIRMKDSEPEAWLNKGLLRLRQDKAAEAMPLIQRAIDAHTIRPALALYARGVANEELGHLKAAYSDLTQARDMAPNWSLPAEQLRRYTVR